MLCKDICRHKQYMLQRHDKRELLTLNGAICFNHTLFQKREDGSYHYLLDEWLGLDPHERLSSAAEVLKEAVKSSDSRAAMVLGEDVQITKTAVMNKVYAIQPEIPFEKPAKEEICGISVHRGG